MCSQLYKFTPHRYNTYILLHEVWRDIPSYEPSTMWPNKIPLEPQRINWANHCPTPILPSSLDLASPCPSVPVKLQAAIPLHVRTGRERPWNVLKCYIKIHHQLFKKQISSSLLLFPHADGAENQTVIN